MTAGDIGGSAFDSAGQYDERAALAHDQEQLAAGPAKGTQHRGSPDGMTGRALRTANETISRQTAEIIQLKHWVMALQKTNADLLDMHEARYAVIVRQNKQYGELQADRDNLWNMLYLPGGEVSQLRTELSQARALIATLEEQLRDAACALLSAGA